MAGRGVSVIVQLLNPSILKSEEGKDDKVKELSLPVALHSPLVIFKERLCEVTGIDPSGQVLILLDLSDPDRNNDKHLDDAHDNMTLRDCGIVNGSICSLHALGISSERAQTLMKDALIELEEKKMQEEIARKGSVVVNTSVTAAQADHSFNGIIFDIESKDAHEVEIMSVSLAGLLGRVRIWARDSSCHSNPPPARSNNYWGHHPGISQLGWTLVADEVCLPSWDRPTEISFNKPFKLLPRSTHGFYCHSGLPDDLGIQYTSCNKREITAFDDHIKILPGFGHCGNTPFDNQHLFCELHIAI